MTIMMGIHKLLIHLIKIWG